MKKYQKYTKDQKADLEIGRKDNDQFQRIKEKIEVESRKQKEAIKIIQDCKSELEKLGPQLREQEVEVQMARSAKDHFDLLQKNVLQLGNNKMSKFISLEVESKEEAEQKLKEIYEIKQNGLQKAQEL